jgi:acyl-CoA thioesterase I
MNVLQSLGAPLIAILSGALIAVAPLQAGPTPGNLTIVAFGDSLTAGYMLQPNESFAAQLQMALAAKGHKVQVVNGGVSGDTTAAGLDRLAWTLQPGADAVILELGANDALRGLDPKVARANLDKMLTTITANGTPVLLAGMKAPGNWGADYVKDFDAIFPDLAAKHSVALYPFFLEGVIRTPALLLSDGMHPTAQGVAEIVKRILPDVEKLVALAETKKSAAKN